MLEIGNIVIALILCTALSVFAYKKNIFNARGGISAFILGIIIAIANLYWFLILLFFLITSSIATKYKYPYKEERMLAEGIKGARDINSVLANGLVSMGIAIIYLFDANYKLFNLNSDFYTILFMSSVASASSDTFASEIGVLSDKTYLITNFKRIKVGTDGGISVLGEIASLFGALIIAFFGSLLYYFKIANYNSTIPIFYFLAIPFVIGFVGCQIDSYLGAIWERKGYLTKGDVNLLSIFVATLIAFFFLTTFK